LGVSALSLDRALAAPDFTDDPYPTYARLRDAEPVHWSDAWGVWVLTRYDDTQTVLRDPATFSNRDRFGTLMRQLPADSQRAAEAMTRHNSVGMLQSDPPDHSRLRALVRQAFTPRVVEGLRPQVTTIVDRLLDAVDPGRFDVVAQVGFRLPITVICALMGLPPEDADLFAAWGDDVASFQATGRAVDENARRAAAAIVAVEEYFRGVVRLRTGHEGEDLISRLTEARDQGDRLTQDELINMCVNFLFAGHQTTEHLIGNGVHTLLCHPQELQAVRSEPALMSSAIEECLRFESPIQRGWRRATRDVQMRGQMIREGDLVFMMFGSANRDPAVFEAPDEFRVRREPNRHLAFGYGIHFCIGAPLARIEAPIAIARLLGRFPRLHVAEPPSWQPNIHLRGLRALWLSAS
jgi:cytochrome P450